MKRVVSRSLLSILVCVFFTQCSNGPFGFGKGTRSVRLDRLGYESVALQKMQGDDRYSGLFFGQCTAVAFPD